MSRAARVGLAIAFLLVASLQAGLFFVVDDYIGKVIASAPQGYGADSSPYRAAKAWLLGALALFILLAIVGVFLLLSAWRQGSSTDELATLTQLLGG